MTNIQTRVTALVVMVIRFSSFARGQSTHPVEQADRAAAERIISELDDPSPEVRAIASLKINNLGPGALEAADKAAADENLSPETKSRVRVAVKYLRPRAINERRERDRLAWESQAFHAAYRAGGHSDPKYDADVLVGIDGYLSLGTDPLHGPAEVRKNALAAFKRAVAAGCDDPLVFALYWLSDGSMRAYVPPSTPRTGIRDPLKDCYHGNYPALVKFRIFGQYASVASKVSGSLIQWLADLLPEALKTPAIAETEITTVLDWQFVPSMTMQEVSDDWEKLFDKYEQAVPGSAYPPLGRSKVRQIVARERRHRHEALRDFQGAIGPEYSDALKAAVDLALEAYRRDPADARATLWLFKLQFERGEIADTRAEVDKWFGLTMALNPDDRRAAELRAYYLSPKIHGSERELLDFAHQCIETQNWHGGIPFVAVYAHEQAADAKGDRLAYFLQPDVWNDLQTVYDGLLVNYPQELERRCEYANYACLSEHWNVARQQFQIIGDQPVMSVFGSDTSYRYLRRKAERLGS